MVCDSIHQLSHQFPTTKSGKEIGDFLGIHKDTVNAAKIVLKEKGLVADVGDGIKTTEKWYRAVTFASTDGKSVEVTENPSSAQYIYNKDITSKTSVLRVSEEEDDLSIEVVDDNGDPFTPKWGKKDTSYREVFALFGEYPKSWERNTTQIKAAKALKKERDWEQVKKAVRFYLDNSEKPFIPNVSTPYDLDT
jgi:hypothetical protein